MNRLRYRLAATVVLVLITTPALAGNWMRSEGEHRLSGGLAYGTVDRYRDHDSVLQDASCRASNWANYAEYEYGWSYYRTAFVSTALLSRQCGSEEERGLGDVQLGIRGRLDPFRNGRTWQAVLILPTGYSRTAPSRLGHGRIGLDVGVDWEFLRDPYRPAPKLDVEAGGSLRLWEGPPSNQVLGYVQGVYRVADGWRGHVGIDGTLSLRDGAEEPIRYTNQRRLVDYDKVSVEVGVAHSFSVGWSVELEARRAIWGRNAGEDRGFALTLTRVWGR